MKKTCTIEDVARLAGVSRTTVSSFLNQHWKNMSAETRAKIERVVRETKYSPSSGARNLRLKRSDTVAVISWNMTGQVSFRFIQGACQALEEAGYNAMVFLTGEDPVKEKNCLARCLSNRLDGIILAPAADDIAFYDSVRNQVPMVLARRQVRGWDWDTVLFDEQGAMNNLADHLFEQGFTKSAFVTDIGPTNPRIRFNKLARCMYFSDALILRGCQPPAVYNDAANVLLCQKAIRDFMDKYPTDKKVIMTANVPTLINVIESVQALKINVPFELGVCGYMAPEWGRILHPSVTCIQQPYEKVGRAAVEMLLRRIRNPSAPVEKRLIPLQIELRQSTLLKS